MAGKPFAVAATPGAADLNNMAYVYDRVTTLVDVVNIATEQTLYTKTITGGHLSTNRNLELLILANVLYNPGTSKTLTLRVKYGGTTFWGDVSDSPATSATRRPVTMTLSLANLGATNSQLLQGAIDSIGTVAAGSIAGTGDFTFGGPGGTTPIRATGAIDSTVDQTLAVTAQWSGADASASVQLTYARLYLV